MSEEIDVVFKEIDIGDSYWNDRIREMQEDNKPLILWITKQVMNAMESPAHTLEVDQCNCFRCMYKAVRVLE